MHVGLVISALLHVAILGWAIFTIQTQRELRVVEPEPVAVELMTPSDVTKLRQGVRTAKQMEAEAKEGQVPDVVRKEAAKKTPVVAKPKTEPKTEPPPEVKEEAKPEVKPEPKAEPPKELAKAEPPKTEPTKDPIAEKLATDQPDPALEQARLEEKVREEQRKADEQKRLEEQKKLDEQKRLAEFKKRQDDAKKRKEAADLKRKQDEAKKLAEAKKKFDAENIAALLNKVPDKGAPQTSTPTDVQSKAKGPVLGAKEGRDQQLSASEQQRLVRLLTEKIRGCYRPPVGAAAGFDALKVRLSFDLKRDGTITGVPKATSVDGGAVLPAAAEAAERALFGCQPYDMLPADKYDFWKGVDLIFNPKDHFGG